MMKRKLGVLCMAVGALLILCSLSMVLRARAEERQAAQAVEAVLPQVREAIERRAAEPTPSPTPQPPVPPDPEATPAVSQMPSEVVDGYACLGLLSFPTLELELPVLDQWDYARLKAAPCRQYGSSYGHDLVVAGHNYDRHFGRLHLLSPGDPVLFTHMDGTVFPYEVRVVNTLAPDAVDQVKNSPWDLVLYTCTPSGRDRVAVGCSLLET